MSVLPLARIGQVLGRPDYIEAAKRQFLVHTKYLADRETGLWFHGWTFEGRHNFAKALWARGNCWVTIAIPEIIEMLDLPEGDSVREFLISTLTAQVTALARYQRDDGLWHTLINDPGSYAEASATAGFAYGILKAVRKRYLPDDYAEMGERAIRAVVANIDPTGELLNVSFGTAMGEHLQYYREVPLTSMPYGQSLAMCALSEFLRRYI
jgi:unsaturated rhamnogalacturonyl hydrolase